MTPEELNDLSQRYLSTQFDEVEERLALDWQPAGLDEWSSQLNERCHELAGALSAADLSTTLALARNVAPGADDSVHRRLARRMIEAQLQAAIAELKALSGEPLARPDGSGSAAGTASASLHTKPTPRVSEVAAMYAEERKARGFWSDKTALQAETIYALISELLGDAPIGIVTKDDVRTMSAPGVD